MSFLSYVPADELKRVAALNGSDVGRAEAFATACRINALYMIARAGSGHIGTSFSCMDILSWLFLEELELPSQPGGAGDVFFSSKGHDAPGIYSVLIATGRLPFDKLHQLRRLNGLPGHPDISIPWMITNTGPLGMGISKAKGMVQANRLKGDEGRIFILTGDGELQEGQIWESLASAVRDRMGEITVIVDRNKVQSDTWVKDVSDLGDLVAKFRAFGWHAVGCDGNDISALQGTLAALRNVRDVPKVIVADTLKGKGVSFMEPDAMDRANPLYKFHSGAPSIDSYEKGLDELVERANRQLQGLGAEPLRVEKVERVTPAAPGPRAQKLVARYSEALVDQGKRNPTLVALDADLVLDCGIIPFRSEFPNRFFECGIAEQDMVSQAGAMAVKGLLPVVHSFACFLSTRPNEQIYNNATEHSKIIYVAPLAGLLPSGPGHSHQSVRDISAVGGTPNLVMIQPSCEEEVVAAMDYAVNANEESTYLRLVSIPVEVPFDLPADFRFQPGRGTFLREGTDAAIIGYGPVMLSEAFNAAEQLASEGIEVAVIDLPWLNRVDAEWLEGVAARFPVLFTIDDHYIKGGQGEFLAATLFESEAESRPRLHRFGIDRVPYCGGNREVLEAHKLDAGSLASQMKGTLATAGAGSRVGSP